MTKLTKAWKSFIVIALSLIMTIGYALPTGAALAADETADCTITVTKTLLSSTEKDDEGNPVSLDIPDGEFTFELYDPSGKKIATAKANDKGFAKFELKGLKKTDSGEYTVKEVQNKKSKYTYDEDKKVTVTVGELTTYVNQIGGSNVETGNSQAMQHYVAYPGKGEEVTYDHGATIAGDGVSFKMITDNDGNSYHAFCMVRNLSSSSSDFPTRGRYAGDTDNGNGTNGTWLDAVRDLNNAWNNENGAPDNNTYASGLLTIMWNGYPHNAENFMQTYGLSKEEFYQVTQHVIYAFGRYGGKYKDATQEPISYNTFRTKAANTELFDKLYNAACIAGQGWTDGVSLSVPWVEGDQVSRTYVHWVGETGQPLLSSWIKGTPETKFQAVATAASFTNTDQPSGEDEFEIEISKNELGGSEIAGAKMKLVDSEGNEVDSWTSTNESHKVSLKAGDYKLTEVTAPDGYQSVTTEIEFTVADDGTVTLKTTEVDGGGKISIDGKHITLEDAKKTDDDSSSGSLATNVMVDGKQATSEAAIYVNFGKKDVTDTIDYKGLVKGATYTVKGTLHNVTDNKDVATASEELEATAESGTWQITFKSVDLEAGKKYVVFEEATEIKDADGNDVTDGDTIEHKDEKDLAQTVIVNKTALEVTKIANKDKAYIGDTIEYTIIIENVGEVDATDVSVIDILPDELTYVKDDAEGENDGQTVEWIIDIPAGYEAVNKLDATVNENAKGSITNMVIVDEVKGEYDFDEDDVPVEVLGVHEPANDTTNNNGGGTQTRGVDTGDEAPIAGALAALLLAGGAFIAIRRRKTN